jgi:hypothetical protein
MQGLQDRRLLNRMRRDRYPPVRLGREVPRAARKARLDHLDGRHQLQTRRRKSARLHPERERTAWQRLKSSAPRATPFRHRPVGRAPQDRPTEPGRLGCLTERPDRLRKRRLPTMLLSQPSSLSPPQTVSTPRHKPRMSRRRRVLNCISYHGGPAKLKRLLTPALETDDLADSLRYDRESWLDGDYHDAL